MEEEFERLMELEDVIAKELNELREKEEALKKEHEIIIQKHEEIPKLKRKYLKLQEETDIMSENLGFLKHDLSPKNSIITPLPEINRILGKNYVQLTRSEWYINVLGTKVWELSRNLQQNWAEIKSIEKTGKYTWTAEIPLVLEPNEFDDETYEFTFNPHFLSDYYPDLRIKGFKDIPLVLTDSLVEIATANRARNLGVAPRYISGKYAMIFLSKKEIDKIREFEKPKKEQIKRLKSQIFEYYNIQKKDYKNSYKDIQNIRKSKTQAEKKLEDIQPKLSKLNIQHLSIKKTLDNLLEPPYVEIIKRNGNYSMFVNESQVLRVDGINRYSMIYTTARNKPFKIKEYKAPLFNPLQKGALEFLSMGIGDFCDSDYSNLYGSTKKYIANIFEQVENGIEIFPTTDPMKVRKKREKKTKPVEDKERDWGKVFLSSLGPQSIEQGELLGSGGSYKAYFFNNGRVIVEFDQTNHATYLLNQENFDLLRRMRRSDIISMKPEGYAGRIIHKGETNYLRQKWRQDVVEYLRS